MRFSRVQKKAHGRLVLLCLLILLTGLGCRKKPADEGRTKRDQGDTIRTFFTGGTGFNIYSMPEEGEFVLPTETVSFAIVAHSKRPGGSIIFRVQDPSGRHVFADLVKGRFLYGSQGSTVLVNPLVPDMPMEKGVWSYKFQNTSSVKMALRTGTVRGILPIRPIFTGTRFDSRDIQGALNALVTLFDTYGLQIQFTTPLHIPDSEYAAFNPDFDSFIVRKLSEYGDIKSINVFFIEELLEKFVLGIAARIPGTFGVYPLNMVMVDLKRHSVLGSDDLVNEYIARTIAHEIGHFVGLFHTTEKDGVTFDPLDDTPKCENPIDGASSGNCDESKGGKNIMFWESSSGQNKFSPSQIHIFKYTPLAQ